MTVVPWQWSIGDCGPMAMGVLVTGSMAMGVLVTVVPWQRSIGDCGPMAMEYW